MDKDSILLSDIDICVLDNNDAYDSDRNIKLTHFTTAAVRHAIEYLNDECIKPTHIDELSPDEADQLKLHRKHKKSGDSYYESDNVNDSLYRYYRYHGTLYRYYKHRKDCPECWKEINEELKID